MIEFIYGTKKPKISLEPHPKFGTAFTPHLLQIDIDETMTPFDPQKTKLVGNFKPVSEGENFKASTLVFHYGQSIFEGLKAFKQESDDRVGIFRIGLHARRFMDSAERMAMPKIGEENFIQAVCAQVAYEKENIPDFEDHALYIRPLMIARDELVKVGRAKKYSFYVITCIVGSYFPGGKSRPAKVLVCPDYVRAVKGGLGEAKTAANYAASLAPQTHGEKLGCDQVLYLDGVNHDSIDELGGMNFFIIKNGEVVTPKLNGAILHGVTRKSILELAPALGLKAREELVSFKTLVEDIQAGRVTEAFACGTAAVVHPIGEFLYQQTKTSTPSSVKIQSDFEIAERIRSALCKIQRGQANEGKEISKNWLTLL